MPDSLIQQPPPIMIPAVLRDLLGREIETQIPLDLKEVIVAVPGMAFGALRFVRSGETAVITGHPVYVQESLKSLRAELTTITNRLAALEGK